MWKPHRSQRRTILERLLLDGLELHRQCDFNPT
jgi:hypothetical protein